MDKQIKKNMCWDCLYEYRCDWTENVNGQCEHFIPDASERDKDKAAADFVPDYAY